MAYGGCFCPDGRFSVSVAPGSARAPGALRNGQQNAPLLSDSADYSCRLCRNEGPPVPPPALNVNDFYCRNPTVVEFNWLT